jgi:BirA family biotin operon repressor/biotin-[acetyl-CoA-carboxylase] ligase
MPFKTHILESCASTNDAAREGRYGHGEVVVARAQSAGRGQQGNRWESEPGANLLLSAVLEPTLLPAAEQFRLLQAVSLAVADVLDGPDLPRVSGVNIKWPNDIYAGGRKIAGILIENDIMGVTVARSIAGIGLNINQTVFSLDLPNPTSIALETGEPADFLATLDRLCGCLETRYAQLENGELGRLDVDYHARLYRLGEQAQYKIPGGDEFTGTIIGVAEGGGLVVEHLPGHERREYLFKQIEFL